MSTPSTLTILGAGGFIGSHLLERILAEGRYDVTGIDITSAKIERFLGHPRFTFVNLNVYDTAGVRRYVEKSDIVISLVALCNPSLYNTIPLEVIDINFLRPYDLVKMCAELGTWLIHFSTSEVYGKTAAAAAGIPMNRASQDQFLLSEDESPLILGPVHAQRWSYACAKQLLERVIYAYGYEKGLKYTVVRPFNFIGPRMDYIPGIDGEGIPRVLACFMEALLFHKPLRLVDGGMNRRNFTFIDDAVDAIIRMLERPQAAQGQIFNIGHPGNEVTIAELARMMVRIYRELRPEYASCEFEVRAVASEEFYGAGYEDSDRRVPDIAKARELLGWEPTTDLESGLTVTMASYLRDYGDVADCREAC